MRSHAAPPRHGLTAGFLVLALTLSPVTMLLAAPAERATLKTAEPTEARGGLEELTAALRRTTAALVSPMPPAPAAGLEERTLPAWFTKIIPATEIPALVEGVRDQAGAWARLNIFLAPELLPKNHGTDLAAASTALAEALNWSRLTDGGVITLLDVQTVLTASRVAEGYATLMITSLPSAHQRPLPPAAVPLVAVRAIASERFRLEIAPDDYAALSSVSPKEVYRVLGTLFATGLEERWTQRPSGDTLATRARHGAVPPFSIVAYPNTDDDRADVIDTSAVEFALGELHRGAENPAAVTRLLRALRPIEFGPRLHPLEMAGLLRSAWYDPALLDKIRTATPTQWRELLWDVAFPIGKMAAAPTAVARHPEVLRRLAQRAGAPITAVASHTANAKSKAVVGRILGSAAARWIPSSLAMFDPRAVIQNRLRTNPLTVHITSLRFAEGRIEFESPFPSDNVRLSEEAAPRVLLRAAPGAPLFAAIAGDGTIALVESPAGLEEHVINQPGEIPAAIQHILQSVADRASPQTLAALRAALETILPGVVGQPITPNAPEITLYVAWSLPEAAAPTPVLVKLTVGTGALDREPAEEYDAGRDRSCLVQGSAVAGEDPHAVFLMRVGIPTPDLLNHYDRLFAGLFARTGHQSVSYSDDRVAPAVQRAFGSLWRLFEGTRFSPPAASVAAPVVPMAVVPNPPSRDSRLSSVSEGFVALRRLLSEGPRQVHIPFGGAWEPRTARLAGDAVEVFREGPGWEPLSPQAVRSVVVSATGELHFDGAGQNAGLPVVEAAQLFAAGLEEHERRIERAEQASTASAQILRHVHDRALVPTEAEPVLYKVVATLLSRLAGRAAPHALGEAPLIVTWDTRFTANKTHTVPGFLTLRVGTAGTTPSSAPTWLDAYHLLLRDELDADRPYDLQLVRQPLTIGSDPLRSIYDAALTEAGWTATPLTASERMVGVFRPHAAPGQRTDGPLNAEFAPTETVRFSVPTDVNAEAVSPSGARRFVGDPTHGEIHALAAKGRRVLVSWPKPAGVDRSAWISVLAAKDDTHVVAGWSDGHVTAHRIEQGQPVSRVMGHPLEPQPITSLEITGEMARVASDGTMDLLPLAQGFPDLLPPTPEPDLLAQTAAGLEGGHEVLFQFEAAIQRAVSNRPELIWSEEIEEDPALWHQVSRFLAVSGTLQTTIRAAADSKQPQEIGWGLLLRPGALDHWSLEVSPTSVDGPHEVYVVFANRLLEAARSLGGATFWINPDGIDYQSVSGAPPHKLPDNREAIAGLTQLLRDRHRELVITLTDLSALDLDQVRDELAALLEPRNLRFAMPVPAGEGPRGTLGYFSPTQRRFQHFVGQPAGPAVGAPTPWPRFILTAMGQSVMALELGAEYGGWAAGTERPRTGRPVRAGRPISAAGLEDSKGAAIRAWREALSDLQQLTTTPPKRLRTKTDVHGARLLLRSDMAQWAPVVIARGYFATVGVNAGPERQTLETVLNALPTPKGRCLFVSPALAARLWDKATSAPQQRLIPVVDLSDLRMVLGVAGRDLPEPITMAAQRTREYLDAQAGLEEDAGRGLTEPQAWALLSDALAARELEAMTIARDAMIRRVADAWSSASADVARLTLKPTLSLRTRRNLRGKQRLFFRNPDALPDVSWVVARGFEVVVGIDEPGRSALDNLLKRLPDSTRGLYTLLSSDAAATWLEDDSEEQDLIPVQSHAHLLELLGLSQQDLAGTIATATEKTQALFATQAGLESGA